MVIRNLNLPSLIGQVAETMETDFLYDSQLDQCILSRQRVATKVLWTFTVRVIGVTDQGIFSVTAVCI